MYEGSIFVLDPRHYRVVLGGHPWIALRRSHLTPLNGVIVACLLILAFWLADSYMSAVATPNELAAQGITIDGEVVSAREEKVNRPKGMPYSNYYLTYQFEAPSPITGQPQMYTNEIRVGKETYHRVMVDKYIDNQTVRASIRYLPSNPRVSLLAGDAVPTSAAAILPVLCVAGVGSAALLLLLWVNIRLVQRDRRLEQAGILLEGEVLACKRVPRGRTLTVALSYRFETPEGQVMEASDAISRPDAHKMPLPEAGLPVMVIYAAPDCYRVL